MLGCSPPKLLHSYRPDAFGGSTIAFGRFFFSCFLLLLLIGCAPRRAQAQFIGYTGPQTVQQTLATAAPCNGVVQNFLVNNLGQISHQVQITAISGQPQTMQLVIQGSSDGINFTNISDILTGAVVLLANPGVSASGYFPVVRAQMLCGPSGTFSLSYSGIAGGTSSLSGAYARSQIEKLIFVAAPANANATFSVNAINTPFGNSAGTLVFNYAATGPAGSSIKLTCSGFNVSTLSFGPYNLDTVNTSQTFTVPSSPCPAYNITYTSGGASATTFQLDYNFAPPSTSGSPFMLFSSGELGVNAITEPAAGTSALSNIIDTRGAKQATLSFSCTAGAVTLNVQEYAEDGSTALALVSPLSAVAAATNTQITFGSESNPSSNTGTLSTTALVRLPQRAIAFSFTNAGGAGTCTARLFLAY